MKIVNVEDYFIPDAGYQINIMPKYLAKYGHDVYIVTSTVEGIHKPASDFFGTENIKERDALYSAQTGVKIVRVPPLTTKVLSGRMIQSEAFFRTVEELNPNVIYVHGNDSLTGIHYLKKSKLNFPTVTDSHMLSMATQNRLKKLFYWYYRRNVTPQIIKNHVPVIRTQNDDFVEKCLGIPLNQSPWISYGSDTLLFHPDEEHKKKFRANNNILENDFVVLYAGKIDEAKGGKLLAEAFREKFRTKRNIILLVIGSAAGEYGNEVAALFSKSENRIIRLPTQKYNDLAKYYQVADLSVFAKQCSLSFYDVQACGLPVLSEDNSINIDRCSHNNGWNFKSGDIRDFRSKIETITNMTHSEYSLVSDNALRFIIQNYNYENKAREYEKILLNEHERFFNK